MRILYTLLLLCLPATHSLPSVAGPSRQSQEAMEVVGLRLRGVDGKTYDTGEMRGNVLLISFGATWCLPCWGELTALEQMKKEYAGKQVRFLWVNIEGAGEMPDKRLREYTKELNVTFPVLRDSDRSAYADFAARVPSPLKQSVKTPVPLVVFVDAAGRFSPPGHFGMTSPESYKTMVRTKLDRLLSSAKAEGAAVAR